MLIGTMTTGTARPAIAIPERLRNVNGRPHIQGNDELIMAPDSDGRTWLKWADSSGTGGFIKAQELTRATWPGLWLSFVFFEQSLFL